MSFHEEEVLGKAYDARLMRRLLGYLRPYKLQVAGALVALVGDALCQLAPPYLVKVAIDRHIAQGDLAGLNGVATLYMVVLAGAFDRFLDLRILMAENQIGWVPTFMTVADERYDRHLLWAQDIFGFEYRLNAFAGGAGSYTLSVTATPGMAAASMYGKARSNTLMQLTPTIASTLPVWMSDITMAEPSATSVA